MIQDYFDEAIEMITDAKKGIVAPSLMLLDSAIRYPHLDPLSLNQKLRFGMGTYMIMTGPPGTGKTSFIDTHYVNNSIRAFILDPENFHMPLIVYNSMERPPVDKMVKWIAYHMYVRHSTLIDLPTLLQHPNKRRLLTDKDIDNAKSFQSVIEHMKKYLDLQGGAKTPTAIKKYLDQRCYDHGVYFTSDTDKIYKNGEFYDDFKTSEGIDKEHPAGKRKKEVFTSENGAKYKVLRRPAMSGSSEKRYLKLYQNSSLFIPKDRNQIRVVINDTSNKLKREPRKDVIETLNDHSSNMADVRDAKAWAPIDINQMNQEGIKEIGRSPALKVFQSHIKGTGDFAQNADIILSIVDPSYFGLTLWGPDNQEYDIKRLRKTFRIFQIVKNSHGLGEFTMHCVFLGENGYFFELPNPENMNEEAYKLIENKLLIKRDVQILPKPEEDLPF